MISKFCMAVCISASAHFSTTDVAQKAEVMVSSTERRIAEGAWVGKFLQKNWAFDLKVENGVWSGKYMIDNKGNWHPLDDVHISDRSVSFNMETQPKVSFSLVIGADNLAMSGTVNIDGVATVPFSAVRKP